jgi:CRISPR/Cas system-associated endoribonuclease Cas2
MEWVVRPVRTGELTPNALRQRAQEFAKLASEARDTVVFEELRKLAREYEAQADRLERLNPVVTGAPAI